MNVILKVDIYKVVENIPGKSKYLGPVGIFRNVVGWDEKRNISPKVGYNGAFPKITSNFFSSFGGSSENSINLGASSFLISTLLSKTLIHQKKGRHKWMAPFKTSSASPQLQIVLHHSQKN